jgi:hypothetical protein
MGTLRPVLESIFPIFDGGNTATLPHGISGYFFYSWLHRGKNKKNRMMPDLDAVS